MDDENSHGLGRLELEAMIDRFGRAGWIAEAGLANERFGLRWSAKGIEKMSAIRAALKAYRPDLIDSSNQQPRRLFAGLLLRWKVLRLTRELGIRLSGSHERRLVMSLAMVSNVDESGRIEPLFLENVPRGVE